MTKWKYVLSSDVVTSETDDRCSSYHNAMKKKRNIIFLYFLSEKKMLLLKLTFCACCIGSSMMKSWLTHAHAVGAVAVGNGIFAIFVDFACRIKDLPQYTRSTVILHIKSRRACAQQRLTGTVCNCTEAVSVLEAKITHFSKNTWWILGSGLKEKISRKAY